jgi:hypothetical protein
VGNIQEINRTVTGIVSYLLGSELVIVLLTKKQLVGCSVSECNEQNITALGIVGIV